MMEQWQIRVIGEIQGIGYRYFVALEAERLNITGWVRNLSNGDVELVAESDEETLKKFLEIIKTKHHWAKVEDTQVSIKKILKKEFPNFRITF